MNLLYFDFEVFKYDWLVCIGDLQNKKMNVIVNSKEELENFYNLHKEDIFIGFNSRHYDQYIFKAILCGLDPYEVSQRIIVKGESGWSISKLFSSIFFYHFDCKPDRNISLKKIEAFMGENIKESSVPFDIDKKLTKEQLQEVIEYCKHDVRMAYKTFMLNIDTFNSHIAMINEFNMPKHYINKTPTQLTSLLLNAKKIDFNDEYDLSFPTNLKLGRYEDVKNYYTNWSKNVKDYSKLSLVKDIGNVKHIYGVGGLHGAVPNFVKKGKFMMIDVGSYYPYLMILYNLLSRAVVDPKKYKQLLEDRMRLKKSNPKRANIRKIPLNGTFGASKDKNNNLYDPRQSNNCCITGQLFLTDLLDKLVDICKIIQTNTDGIGVEIETDEQEKEVISVCEEWCNRTKFTLDYKYYDYIIQRDVNNYIMYNSKTGELKQKGKYQKKSKIKDNEMSIVLEAIVNYFIYDKPIEDTIYSCNELEKFMIIANIGSMYECILHNGKKLTEKVNRVFASKNKNDTSLFKRKRTETRPYALEKCSGTPLHSFIDNGNIIGKECPPHLDKDWYVYYTKYQMSMIFGNEYEGISTNQWQSKLWKTAKDYEKGTGSDKLKSKNYNPNKDRDIMINMIGKVIIF